MKPQETDHSAILANRAAVSRRAKRTLTILSTFALLVFVLVLGFCLFGFGYSVAHFLGFVDRKGLGVYPTVLLGGICLGLLLGLWRVLTARCDLPHGVYVDRTMCPTLWKAVGDIARATDAPLPDKIVLLPIANAFAAEIPENGIFRPRTKVLGLGYPLLKLLSLEQGGAVIAHEMQHFGGGDTRSTGFNSTAKDIVRLLVEDSSSYNVLLAWPAGWYLRFADRVEAKASQLSEYAADARAAELFGSQAAADALIMLDASSHSFQERIWAPLMQSLEDGKPAPDSIMRALDETARSQTSRDSMQRFLDLALVEETARQASHPCLSDRIKALGALPVLPAFDGTMSAARAFLWDDEDGVRQTLDDLIKEDFGQALQSRAAEVAEVERIVDKHLPTVETREQAEVLSLLMERSLSSGNTHDRHAAIVQRFGDIPSSVCDLAFVKIKSEDPQGLDELLGAFERHPSMAGEAKHYFDWLFEVGRKWTPDDDWMRDWANNSDVHRRLENANTAMVNEDAAIKKAFKTGDFRPHGLADWHIDLIVNEARALLEEIGAEATHMWLLRKAPAGALKFPVFQMIIETRQSLDGAPTGLGARSCTPGPLQYIFKGQMEPAIGQIRTIMNAPGALIYSTSPLAPARARAA